MFDVTVRFYVTTGGLMAALLLMVRISFQVGRFKQSVEDYIAKTDQKLEEHTTDIRELRARRR